MNRVMTIGLVLMMTGGPGTATAAPAPQVGAAAPDFSLPYATKDAVAKEPLVLSSLVGKHNIVLAFYPADWSGGCTKEVCAFRDNFTALGNLNADVIGISGDLVWSHHEWAKHHELPFRLAADHMHDAARKYGSFDEESGYTKRTLFVIDKAGKIAYADMAYSPRDNASFEKLQAALANLK